MTSACVGDAADVQSREVTSDATLVSVRIEVSDAIKVADDELAVGRERSLAFDAKTANLSAGR